MSYTSYKPARNYLFSVHIYNFAHAKETRTATTMNNSQPKKALILMNLGSPDSTAVPDVRKYLQEFLMDEFVIDYPYVFRYLLVNGIISRFRAPKSAEAYKKVWMKEGSPLIVLTNKLRDAVQEAVNYPVFSMMRYGSGSPQEVFDKIQTQYPSVEEVIVLPLYPHWTMSSFETAVVYSRRTYEANNYIFKLRFLNPFYNHPEYISALAESIKPHLANDFDKLLFSYHGLPERHMIKDDAKRVHPNRTKDFDFPEINYQKQCFETSRLVAEYLGLPESKYTTSFQSRLTAAGKEWIKPYTAPLIDALPAQGVKKLLVVCPAFINDCLETLEEIAMEAKHDFMENGGETFTYIPCLNDDKNLVDTIVKWAK